MTKEEILKMEAGEELDKLVATEIMGEPIPDFTPPNALELQLAGSPVKSPQGNWLSRCKYSEGDIPTWRPLPYSTDISAAWPLVGKLSPFIVQLAHYPSRNSHVAWVIEDRNGSFTIAEVEAKAAPEAICKATLLAKYSHQNT